MTRRGLFAAAIGAVLGGLLFSRTGRRRWKIREVIAHNLGRAGMPGDAARFFHETGGETFLWSDQSGNGNHASMGISGPRTVFVIYRDGARQG